MLRNIIIALIAALALAVPAYAQTVDVAAIEEMDFGNSAVPAPEEMVVAPQALPDGYSRGRLEESVASSWCSASCPCTARVWKDAPSISAESAVRIWANDCKARQVIPDAWLLYRTSMLFPGATIKPYQP